MARMNRAIRSYRMEGIKERFANIWKDLNMLITECKNENMEDKTLDEIITARAVASAGEKLAATCIRMDKKLDRMESGE